MYCSQSCFRSISDAEEIVRDFSSQQLQKEWDSFRNDILKRRDKRIQQRVAVLQASEQERQVRAAQRAPRQQVAQAALDKWQAKFADDSIALEYDANRLAENFGLGSTTTSARQKALPCLGERAHWIDCSKKYSQDPRPCDVYMAALQRCVNETIIEDNH